MLSNSAFISYRRATSGWVARTVHQNLCGSGIDSFLDLESIGAGDFRVAIDREIRERPYFLPIFSAGALVRCSEPDDPLLGELAKAVEANRRIVPLVTTEFDRKEISTYLPGELSNRYLVFNSITMDLEYFDAAMDKLRRRFLAPVEVPPPIKDGQTLSEARHANSADRAATQVAPVELKVQMHLERAFTAVERNPSEAALAFEAATGLLAGSPSMNLRTQDIDLAGRDLQTRLLQVQASLSQENARLNATSRIMRVRHDMMKNALQNIR